MKNFLIELTSILLDLLGIRSRCAYHGNSNKQPQKEKCKICSENANLWEHSWIECQFETMKKEGNNEL